MTVSDCVWVAMIIMPSSSLQPASHRSNPVAGLPAYSQLQAVREERHSLQSTTVALQVEADGLRRAAEEADHQAKMAHSGPAVGRPDGGRLLGMSPFLGPSWDVPR